MADTWFLNNSQPSLYGAFDGAMAILNRETVLDRRIEIREISMLPVGAFNSAGISGYLTLSRISAAVDGTAAIFQKHDTASADLPSQVSFSINPTSVTIVSTQRRVADQPNLVATTLQLGQKTQGITSRLASSALLGGVDSSIQSIVLREGEGIALTQTSPSFPHKFYIRVIITNISSGETYKIGTLEADYGNVNDAIFSLVNGSGSGVVLDVRTIFSIELGSGESADFRLAYIDGVNGGTSLTPVAMDSATMPLSNVSFYAGPFFGQLAGAKQSAPQDWQTNSGGFATIAVQHIFGTYSDHFNPSKFAEIGAANIDLRSLASIIYKAGRDRPGILIKPGQGFAILSGHGGTVDTSVNRCYEMCVIFTHSIGVGSGVNNAKEIYVKPPTKRSVSS